MKHNKPEYLLWLLSIISRISFAAALLSIAISILFFLRFDPEPPTDSPILKDMLTTVYESSDIETVKESYRQWHYLSLGAYFTSRNQYNYGVIISTVFTLIYFFSSGFRRTLSGAPQLRKKRRSKAYDMTWKGLGIIILLITTSLLPLFNNSSKGTEEILPQTYVTPYESAHGNWNSFRGPLTGRRETSPPNPDLLEKIWEIPTGRQGHSSPVIWDNQIYVTGADKEGLEIMKIDLDSGNLLWSADFPVNPETLPEVSFDTGWAPSTPVCDENGIYALFGNGILIALDHEGEILWNLDLGSPDNPYGHGSSLAIYRERLFIQYDQSDRAYLKAISASDGREIWSAERQSSASWSSPVPVFYENKVMIVTASEPFISAYNAYTGEEIWRTESLHGEVAPTIAWDDENIYAVQEGAGVLALKIENGIILWRNEEGPQSDVPSPVVSENYLIMPTSYGILSLYDKVTGELSSFEERFDSSYASPVLWGDLIFWPDMLGTLVIYQLGNELIPVGEISLGVEVLATPSIGSGLLIIRGRETLSAWGVSP